MSLGALSLWLWMLRMGDADGQRAAEAAQKHGYVFAPELPHGTRPPAAHAASSPWRHALPAHTQRQDRRCLVIRGQLSPAANHASRTHKAARQRTTQCPPTPQRRRRQASSPGPQFCRLWPLAPPRCLPPSPCRSRPRERFTGTS
ncbi:hypothetical protein DFH27DRAFT_615239 [Peziza echinospora]|nr:hypothetical protein DFH27DRAFT_615239 [Peziza echinospora]